MVNHLLRNYLSDGFPQVEGWCDAKIFEVMELLCSIDINKNGGCLELGVHHGKFFILLNTVISGEEKSYAVDVFGDQSLNIDHSGAGSIESFKRNLSKYCIHKGRNVEIIAGDSTDPALRLRELIGVASLRFISVDGGHTAQHTINDLRLASDLIANQGVVILDDILNQDWLGVIEGVCKFLDQYPTLVPFAIGYNKLFMCKLSYYEYYFKIFSESKLPKKIVNFFGRAIASCGDHNDNKKFTKESFFNEPVTQAEGELVADLVPSVLQCGHPVPVNVTLSNMSTKTWHSFGSNPVLISYHWLKVDGSVYQREGTRTPLTCESLEPSKKSAEVVTVIPPETEGSYQLVLTLVQEGVCWFEDRGFRCATAQVTVERQAC